MGALHGSLSYLRFLVSGPVAKDPATAFEKAIESRRFLPLQPEQELAESAGWMALEAPYDESLPLTRDLFLFGDRIAVAYREDKWAIPKPVLKRETQKRIERIMKEEKKHPDEIGKAFTKAVELAVLAELKRKTMPRSKVVDVVWDLARSEVRIFARGTIATERIASLFERTFQVRIEPGNYAVRAFALDLSTRAQGVLERLGPGWLFPDAWQSAEAEVREKLSDDDAGGS